MRRSGATSVRRLCALMLGLAAITPASCTREKAGAEPERKTETAATTAESPVTPPPPAQPSIQPSPSPAPPGPAKLSLREVFPHVRVDAEARVVEFDGRVPINAHNEKSPRVYLEVIACTPDTKEHETLVVTEALPSHVHAAMLLIGLAPGKPGSWDWEGKTLVSVPPTGDRVSVMAVYERDGRVIEQPITDWVASIRDGKTLTELATQDGWLFAGSTMVTRGGREWYRSDGEGTLVGLTCFGSETVAWSRMFNPDSGVEDPHWIANRALVPALDTKVVVRISALGGPAPSGGK